MCQSWDAGLSISAYLSVSQSKDTLQTDNVLVATGQQVSLVIIMETWVLVQS